MRTYPMTGVLCILFALVFCGVTRAQQVWQPSLEFEGGYYAVAAADVNGDGFQDVIGGYRTFPNYRLSIWSGLDGSLIDSLIVDGSTYPCPGSEVEPEPHFGEEIVVVGDVDGVPGDEFVVALPHWCDFQNFPDRWYGQIQLWTRGGGTLQMLASASGTNPASFYNLSSSGGTGADPIYTMGATMLASRRLVGDSKPELDLNNNGVGDICVHAKVNYHGGLITGNDYDVIQGYEYDGTSTLQLRYVRKGELIPSTTDKYLSLFPMVLVPGVSGPDEDGDGIPNDHAGILAGMRINDFVHAAVLFYNDILGNPQRIVWDSAAVSAIGNKGLGSTVGVTNLPGGESGGDLILAIAERYYTQAGPYEFAFSNQTLGVGGTRTPTIDYSSAHGVKYRFIFPLEVDLNNDGYDDYMVGAPTISGTFSRVFDGSPTDNLSFTVDLGGQVSDFSVDADFNNDGYNDLLVAIHALIGTASFERVRVFYLTPSFHIAGVMNSQVDADADGIIGALDNCPDLANPSQLDSDGDGRGDYCDLDPLQVVVRNWPLTPARGTESLPPGDPQLNLRVTEPNTGRSIGADSLDVITNQIGLTASYNQIGANDSVVIDHVKYGDYLIEIIPEAGKTPGSQYTIGVRTDGTVEAAYGPFDSPLSGERDTLYYSMRSFLWGDCDVSGKVNIGDVTAMIARIFAGGVECSPVGAGDADCSASFNIGDVTYLIAYIFSGGPQPGCAN